MSISHEQIIEACWPILEEVGFHEAKIRHPRRFITGYRIWLKLKENNNPICALLEEKYGKAVGEGGGLTEGAKKDGNIVDGVIKRIGQALGNCKDIETQFIVTNYLHFNGIPASDPKDCGLFRLKKKN